LEKEEKEGDGMLKRSLANIVVEQNYDEARDHAVRGIGHT
jgi:hypothetical protein